MARTGKIVALSTAALGVGFLVVVGIVLKPWLVEEYYIRELQSTDEDRRVKAADALGEMKSVRAVPYLIHVLAGEKKESGKSWRRTSNLGKEEGCSLTPVAFALYSIGKDAVPQLLAEVGPEDHVIEGRSKLFVTRLIVQVINSRDQIVERESYEYFWRSTPH